jgi:XRE family transcriptional regulator, regulator of sulfur utilization
MTQKDLIATLVLSQKVACGAFCPLAKSATFAALVLGAALCVAALAADSKPTPVMHSAAFSWDAAAAKTTEVGAVRQFFRAPTATLAELEYHATTLNPGLSSHPPHKHVNEELVIVKEGTVEALVNGKWERLGPGAVIFNASNELHGIRNVGETPATYHVINWTSPQHP